MAKKVVRKSKVTLGGELMFVSDYVGAPELKEKDVTVTISAVIKEQVAMTDGGKKTKLVIRFKETPKKLICNKTNADSIAAMYGTKAEAWAGKKITLYPTTTMAFGEMVECIRVREKAPGANTPTMEPPKQDNQPTEQMDATLAKAMKS